MINLILNKYNFHAGIGVVFNNLKPFYSTVANYFNTGVSYGIQEIPDKKS